MSRNIHRLFQIIHDPTYNFSFEDNGYSDLTLIIGSVHGCSDTLTRTEVALLNGYSVELFGDSLFCFDGNESIDATFEANIIPEYDINLSEFEISHLWDINPIQNYYFV